MNKAKIKFIVFLLVSAFVIGAFSGCSKGQSGASSGAEDLSSAAEQSEDTSEEGKIRVEIDGTVFSAAFLNDASHPEAEVLLFDRNFRTDGGYELYAHGADPARALITVKLVYKYGRPSYSILSYVENADSGVKAAIPVNGFVLSVASSLIPEGFKGNSMADVSVSGWDMPEFELLDLASVIPEDRNNARRVNMTYPKSGSFEAGKIYFCDKGYTVPQDSAAVELSAPSAGYYKIFSLVPAGGNVSSERSILFTGEYNAAYAKEFFASGELRLSSEELLNDICDSPAVAFGRGDYIVIPRHNVNPLTADNGVYLYDISGSASVTSVNGDFINVVVRGDKVAYVSEKRENVAIPSSDGYVVTFAGKSVSLCENIECGDTVKDLLISRSDLPGMFVRVKSNVYELNAVNIPLSASYPCVLYTPLYGDSTGNTDCAEITVRNGEITAVSKNGNSAIPADGYVLSVKKGNKNYASAANRSSEGDPALVSVGGNMYSYSTFHYNATNATRQADFIVIYNDQYGKTTNTNVYGYEFAVDENGKI
ncbi:MAG: hypothetical protein II135_04845, partial [Clostridia bacterium]|nr:hypothetical protein [Clostridia bacterium]